MKRKINLIIYIILIFIFILSLISCGNTRNNEDIKNYLDEFVRIENRFIDKYGLAGTTARIGLSPVISEMQNIRRELENLETPENQSRLLGVEELCLSGMDKAIRGFQEFQMENEEESLSLLREADDIFISVNNTIYEIRIELNK